MAQVLISFADLRRLPGSSALERDWIACRAGAAGLADRHRRRGRRP
jgi:hypothetical protein